MLGAVGTHARCRVRDGTLTIAVMQSDAFGLEFQPHTHPIALHVEDVGAARAELEAHGVAFPADTLDSGVCHMAHFRGPGRQRADVPLPLRAALGLTPHALAAGVR